MKAFDKWLPCVSRGAEQLLFGLFNKTKEVWEVHNPGSV